MLLKLDNGLDRVGQAEIKYEKMKVLLVSRKLDLRDSYSASSRRGCTSLTGHIHSLEILPDPALCLDFQ